MQSAPDSSILTWYREDGDQEDRPAGGRRVHCTPHAAEHLHWAKSVQMGYAIFDSGSVATLSPFPAFYSKYPTQLGGSTVMRNPDRVCVSPASQSSQWVSFSISKRQTSCVPRTRLSPAIDIGLNNCASGQIFTLGKINLSPSFRNSCSHSKPRGNVCAPFACHDTQLSSCNFFLCAWSLAP